MYSVDTKLEKLKYLNCISSYVKYLSLYLNTVLTKVFAIAFECGKLIVFVFVFKYSAMYLDPRLISWVWPHWLQKKAAYSDKIFGMHRIVSVQAVAEPVYY